MMAAVSGMALGCLQQSTPVILAGGTQMAAVLMVIRKLLGRSPEKIAVCTTRYVLEDRSANLRSLISSVNSHVPLIATDPGLAQSSKQGLRAYAEGFVKEGVGAGGSILGAILHSGFTITPATLLERIEENYETIVEKQSQITSS
jgi:NaMN:DMB phosphoribosyltransferase